ncbi:MAG: DNA polymerase II large subunit [Candidatus Micrarchaeia archaeon]
MDYFEYLEKELENCYSIASKARKQGFDPEEFVEIKITSDVASRVEGIVGPPGIEKIIREMEKEGMNRVDIAFEIVEKIAKGETTFQAGLQERIEQAVRTGVAIITEGVLVAPTEGITNTRILENPDKTSYVSIYYAGPIRSAGGTAAALSVVLADIARRAIGIGDYRPTDSEVERYVEEVNMYEARITHLQYKPPDEHVRIIVKNCPICIDGVPTEDVEVSVHKNLERVQTNRIRGGIPLVICEGIAQKASKLLKYTKKKKIEWDWLEKIIKVRINEDKIEIKPDDAYLDGLVAGRPVFSYPSLKGGFRLRYGKTRTNGLMAKNIHPATMILLDEFLAFGTQMKIERPGKGCVIATCSNCEPPVVRLKNGDVLKVKTANKATEINPEVEKILFLGDIISSVGDFVKSNHPLVVPGYCEEWWEEEANEKGINITQIQGVEWCFNFCKKNSLPLHPKYTFFWDCISLEKFGKLISFIEKAELKFENGKLREFKLPDLEEKEILEELLIEHIVRDGKIILDEETGYSLLATLGILKGEEIDTSKIKKRIADKKPILPILSEMCGIKIMARGGTFIGARMGRPEKSKERAMDGKPNVLFPTGSPKNRNLSKIYKEARETEDSKRINLEIVRFKCKNCSNITIYPKCELCNEKTQISNVCPKCRAIVSGNEHCGIKTNNYDKRPIEIGRLFEQMKKIQSILPEDIRGVKGLSSKEKTPERLEKGLFRANHGVYVYKDGTSRFDATDVPLTHFKPNEIGVSLEKIKELGYEYDHLGNKISDGEQMIPLKIQDLLLSERGAEYFIRVSKFIDDLLVNFYRIPAYYKIEKKEDLIGSLMVGLSPHTSAGVLCRVIGFTKANVGYAHPYMHAAKRRNADADEDGVMLLMDALLNFSKKYLNDRIGGTMDTPIVLSKRIVPNEVDDEVFCIELVERYPLEFYRACEKNLPAHQIKIKRVEDILGKEEQYGNFPFTLDSSSIHDGVVKTAYVNLESIPEKIKLEFELMKKISCVNVQDVAKRLILSHFIPDLYGNMRSYSRQNFRCVNCNEIYRRIPLIGKCRKCSGNLTLTIHKGGIEKYLQITANMCEEYDLPIYMKQRIELLKKEIKSVFEDEKIKQMGLSEFI